MKTCKKCGNTRIGDTATVCPQCGSEKILDEGTDASIGSKKDPFSSGIVKTFMISVSAFICIVIISSVWNQVEVISVSKSEKASVSNSEKTGRLITLYEYNLLSVGDSYEEVVAVIGSHGKLMSEAGEKGTDLYATTYMWDGEGETGANAILLFQDNKLTTKAQSGLK